MKLTLNGAITAADSGARTISGRIVTWNEVGNTSQGPTVFLPNSISASGDIPLRLEHSATQPLGRARNITATAEGMDGTFRIMATTAGNDALVEAAEGLRSGFSVGANITEYEYDSAGTLIISAAQLEEVSLVVTPAISSAQVLEVAASENTPEESEEMNPEETVETVEVVEEEAVAVEASKPSHLATIRTTPRPVFASAADYIHAFVAASNGSKDAGLKIQAANQSVSDNPGLIPTPLYGNVVTFTNDKRPVVVNSRSLPLPSAGATFIRPKVTQHTLVGKQAKEFDALASQQMKVTPLTVTKDTYGGQLKISFQDAAWTDPAILNLVIADMAANYAVQTDAAAGTVLKTAATTTAPLAADADAKATIAAIIGAGSTIASKIYEMPDVIYCSFDQWARLASLVDTTGRQVFPFSGPMNAAGGAGAANSMEMNVLGLRVVPDANLAAGTLIVGRSEYLETFETVGGQLSLQNPGTLSFDVAYYGFFSSVVVEAGAFVTLKPGA
jgi:HK97 family phage prohead protease